MRHESTPRVIASEIARDRDNIILTIIGALDGNDQPVATIMVAGYPVAVLDENGLQSLVNIDDDQFGGPVESLAIFYEHIGTVPWRTIERWLENRDERSLSGLLSNDGDSGQAWSKFEENIAKLLGQTYASDEDKDRE